MAAFTFLQPMKKEDSSWPEPKVTYNLRIRIDSWRIKAGNDQVTIVKSPTEMCQVRQQLLYQRLR